MPIYLTIYIYIYIYIYIIYYLFKMIPNVFIHVKLLYKYIKKSTLYNYNNIYYYNDIISIFLYKIDFILHFLSN